MRKSCCCSELSARASRLGSFSQRLQGSLEPAQGPPPCPSGLGSPISRFGSAPHAIWHTPQELPPESCQHSQPRASFAAVSWPCLNSLHGVERDRTPLKAIFDSRAMPDAVPLCLCGHVAPGHIPVVTSTCPSWSQLRRSQMTSPNPALPAPPHHLHDLLSLVVL